MIRDASFKEILLLAELYRNDDWKHRSYTNRELAEKIRTTPDNAYRSLERLKKKEYIKKISSWPTLWEPIKDENLRQHIIKQHREATKQLLNAGDEPL